MGSRRSFAATLLLGSLAWGCNTGRAPAAVADRSGVQAPAAEMRSAAAADKAVAASGSGAAAQPAKATALDAMVASRKLIRTGDLSIEVASYEKAAQEATRLAESLGGYVADSRSSRAPDGKEHGTLSLRVPAERFGQSLSGVKGLGTVRAQNVTAQDVTKAYTDLETRLRVKRDTADRLREILKTRTAGLSDILTAERELARITEEIEQLEGERRFYDQQVALSTLNLQLDEPGADAKPGAFEPIVQAFKDSLRLLATSASGIIYFTAVLAPWLGVMWLLWVIFRAIRNRRKRTLVA